jgi:hypothetical protein
VAAIFRGRPTDLTLWINTARLAFYRVRNEGTWGSAVTSEDLRRENASLHDTIEQVLEMHPELRDGAEAIALRQDLHVEVGAPFLERTRDKLQERARSLIERRPELEQYFEGIVPPQACRKMTPRETKLTAALDANAALRVQAEQLIAAYVAPECDRATIINELITLFDGPTQREAQELAAEALAEGQESEATLRAYSPRGQARQSAPRPNPTPARGSCRASGVVRHGPRFVAEAADLHSWELTAGPRP